MATNGGGSTGTPVISPNEKSFFQMNQNKLYGVILAGLAVIAYVALSVIGVGENLQNFVLFVTPFITLLLVKDKLDDIGDTAQRTEHQTNGMLTQRLNDAMERAVNIDPNTLNRNTDIEKDITNG